MDRIRVSVRVKVSRQVYVNDSKSTMRIHEEKVCIIDTEFNFAK